MWKTWCKSKCVKIVRMGRVMYERYKNMNWYKDLMSECFRANIFRPFGPQFGLKIRGRGGAGSAPALSSVTWFWIRAFQVRPDAGQKFPVFCFLFFALFLSLIGYVCIFISTEAKVLTKTPTIMKLFWGSTDKSSREARILLKFPGQLNVTCFFFLFWF